MAYINRWISADTLVPDAADSQSLNRYTWVLNGPLHYRDPSGYVASGEEADARSIIEQLLLFGIWIEIDFGWLPVMHPAPGEAGSVWESGAWELSTLSGVLQGTTVMASAMGGQESFKQTFSHGLTFERESVSQHTPDAVAETLHRIITIFDLGALKDSAGLQSTVVHELAHAWDQECGGRLSRRLVEITGGKTTRTGFWIGGFNVWGTEGYSPVEALHDRAGTSRGEDWAYSAEAWVLGHGSPRSDLTVDRQFYLRNRFPGIEGSQRGAQ